MYSPVPFGPRTWTVCNQLIRPPWTDQRISHSPAELSLVVRGVPVLELRWCDEWRIHFADARAGLQGESGLELYFKVGWMGLFVFK